jgi:hypothetical protein
MLMIEGGRFGGNRMGRVRWNVALALSVGLVLTFAVSCAKNTMIPQTNWVDLDSSTGKKWEVKRKGDVMYRVQRFAVADSTMILEEVSEVLYYDWNAYPPGYKTRYTEFELPIKVPFSEITSIECVEGSGKGTTLGMLGIFGVIALVTAVAFAAYGLSTL